MILIKLSFIWVLFIYDIRYLPTSPYIQKIIFRKQAKQMNQQEIQNFKYVVCRYLMFVLVNSRLFGQTYIRKCLTFNRR